MEMKMADDKIKKTKKKKKKDNVRWYIEQKNENILLKKKRK